MSNPAIGVRDLVVPLNESANIDLPNGELIRLPQLFLLHHEIAALRGRNKNILNNAEQSHFVLTSRVVTYAVLVRGVVV